MPNPLYMRALFAGVALVGCGAEAPDRSSVVVRDSAGVRIVENTAPAWGAERTWRLGTEPLVSLGGGTTDTEQLFEVVGALRLSDGRLVVANSGTHELRFYGRDGKFLSASAGQGGGPGEFERLTSIHRYLADSLAVYDSRHRRVSLFDDRGTFSRTLLLRNAGVVGAPRVQGVLADGSLVIQMGTGFAPDAEGGVHRPGLPALRLLGDLSTADTLGVFPGREMFLRRVGRAGIIMGVLFGRSTTLRASGDRVYVATNDTYEVKILNIDGALQTIVRRHHPAVLVTDDDFDRIMAERLEGIEGDDTRQRLTDVMRETPLAETFPAYSDIRLDAIGNLWVEEYNRPGDERRVWTVFDIHGTWLGPVEFPPGFAPLDIGTDYVLGSWRDEFDVERVRLYELRKPRG